LQELELHQGLE